MNAKNIVTVILLLFVAASVVWLAMGEGNTKQAEPTGESTSAVIDSGFVATYFHGMRRCATCEKLEEYSRKSVRSGFAEQLDSGQLQWRVVNYDQPGNEHYLTDYDLTYQSIVIMYVEADSVMRWRSLNKIWDLVGDEDAFVTYVQSEIANFIGER